MRDGEIFISKLSCIFLISVLCFVLLATSTGCFFLFLRVGMADTMLRSKVCIADVTLQLPFTSTCSPTSNSVLSTLSKCKYMVSKERWEVVSVGMLSAIIYEMSASCRIHLGSWRNTMEGNGFFRVLSPGAGTVLQPSQLGSVGQNSLPPNLLGVAPLLQSHLWERQNHVQSLSLFLSYFFRSGISATLMLPQQRLSKYICRKSLTTVGHIPISNARKTTGADFKNISLFRRHWQRRPIVQEFNRPWTRIL